MPGQDDDQRQAAAAGFGRRPAPDASPTFGKRNRPQNVQPRMPRPSANITRPVKETTFWSDDNHKSMPVTLPVPAGESQSEQGSFALILIYLATIVPAVNVIAVILAYSRRPTAGAHHEGHYSNIISMFWISALSAVLFSLSLILKGIKHAADKSGHDETFLMITVMSLAVSIAVIWYSGREIYKFFKGIWRALRGRPY